MRDFEYSEEPSRLARRMIAYGNTWLYNSALYDEEINERQIARHADILLSTLYAYLTDLGKDQYQEGIPASF